MSTRKSLGSTGSSSSNDDGSLLDSCHTTRTIYLAGGIDDTSTVFLSRELKLMEHKSKTEAVVIAINSTGGSVIDGLAIYDILRLSPCPIETRVIGSADSIAAWILQAGDLRTATKNSHIMIHQGERDVGPSSKETVDAWNAYIDILDEVCVEILKKRMQSMDPKITNKQIRKLLQVDTILTPEQAISVGLLDNILE